MWQEALIWYSLGQNLNDPNAKDRAGGTMYILGRVGESYSKQAMKSAFGHLGDAIDYFNTAHAKGASRSHHLKVSLMVRVKDSKFMPTIGFTF